MIIRPYTIEDKQQCVEVFESNRPKFFDKEELPAFIKWLGVQGEGIDPAYSNAEKDEYFVIEENKRIIACAGFYIVKGAKKANLAWGMIHSDFHKKGYGTTLYMFRKDVIRKQWPGYAITMGTSQHTYPFYEKMGMKVVASFKDGYGPSLDRLDMEEA